MALYNIISILCLCLMVVSAALVVYNLITKPRANKIIYIRDFKKGKSVLVYVYAIPLLWIGLIYDGQNIFNAFINSISEIGNLILLRYDISSVQLLMSQNLLYSISIYVCYLLAALNIGLFIISLANEHLWNYFKNVKLRTTKKEKLILFGNNPDNYSIYKSELSRNKTIADKFSNSDTLDLYLKNITYTRVMLWQNYIKRIVLECTTKNKKIISVINTTNDNLNIELCRYFTNELKKLSVKEQSICFNHLAIYVFGNPEFSTIYENLENNGLGCISFINKYQKLAIDFINNYPLTKFMNKTQVDYSSALINNDVNINVVFVGFGNTNQQIFLTSVANNQFITNDANGEIVIKKVNYHIFDKKSSESNKNLNHSYYRYKNEFSCVNTDDYLPLPEYPAEEFFHKLDINDFNFYVEIKNIISKSKNDVNCILISYGSDLENIDMAQKISTKAVEWNVNNLQIFAKIRGNFEDKKIFNENNIIPLYEKDIVYNIDNIVGSGIYKMAKLRDELYSLERTLSAPSEKTALNELIEINKNQAELNWHLKKSQLERESSIYCCLSLREKLNLMGLDYCAETQNETVKALSEDEYISIYAANDKPNISYYSKKINGKAIVHYSLVYKDSLRKNLAILEHYRWNSFMLSKGMIPSSKEQILHELTQDPDAKATNGKNYRLRRHGNLTTFNGLISFREMIAKRDNVSEETVDVIKYDYQILDDAYWLLKQSGQKIYKIDC